MLFFFSFFFVITVHIEAINTTNTNNTIHISDRYHDIF